MTMNGGLRRLRITSVSSLQWDTASIEDVGSYGGRGSALLRDRRHGFRPRQPSTAAAAQLARSKRASCCQGFDFRFVNFFRPRLSKISANLTKFLPKNV